MVVLLYRDLCEKHIESGDAGRILGHYGSSQVSLLQQSIQWRVGLVPLVMCLGWDLQVQVLPEVWLTYANDAFRGLDRLSDRRPPHLVADLILEVK